MENQKIKELVSKIREELKEPTENINQYLTEIETLTTEESEAEKKLFEELGISADLAKKKVVLEVQRLAKLKNLNAHFTNDKDKIPSKIENNTITLFLNQTDNSGDFNPNLVLWNFTEELTHFETNSSEKVLVWWKELIQEQIWVKDNLSSEYQKEYSRLLQPSTFPNDKLNINTILVVNDLEGKEENVNSDFSVNSQIVDKAWEIVKKKAQELEIRAIIHYNQPNYTIMINYASDDPNIKELEKLMTETPLKLENEELKKEKEQLPTPENFEKLSKQKTQLENYLQDLTDEEKFKEIKEKVEKND